MANLKMTIVLALLAFTTMQQNNVCLRNKFIGGPQNTIIKAQELLDSLLQYSNVSTTVLYFGSQNAQNAVTGETSVYYFFKINDISNTQNPSRLLIMQITTSQTNTFVDSYILVPSPITGNAASIAFVNGNIANLGPNFTFANGTAFPTSADFFANDANAQPCNLIKEYYTYFYQVFGEKFKKDLNK